MNEATFLACLAAAWGLTVCGEQGGGGLFYALAVGVLAAGVSLVCDQGEQV